MTVGIKDFEPPSNLAPFRQTGRFTLWSTWYVRALRSKDKQNIIITTETISEQLKRIPRKRSN